MKLIRLFSTEAAKGSKQYLSTQKVYEIVRTFIYFFISGSLFVAGILATGTRANLLTIVAVLGCLPAAKSAISAFMFCRYKSLDRETEELFEAAAKDTMQLFDLVFTSYDKNYPVSHMVIKGNTLCGYSEYAKFDDKAFQKHLESCMKLDRITDLSIKIFHDKTAYLKRLPELAELQVEEKNTAAIVSVLKSISL